MRKANSSPQTPNSRKAIFILGMHRSGTSALARVVNLLGAHLGRKLMAAAEDNQKGFFEHEGVVQIHEQLLTDLDSYWWDGTPLPKGWEKSEPARRAAEALEKIIDREFAKSELWAIKDPRQCRLMPLWLPLLKKRGIKPYFIIAWRQPVEVAASLEKRDGMGKDSALLCWLGYTLEAMLAAEKFPQSVVSYEELLKDWKKTMRRVAKDLAIEWPVTFERASTEISHFLSPSLRHHKARKQTLPEPVEDCIKLLNKPNKATLGRLYRQWQKDTEATAPILRDARKATLQLLAQLEEQTRRAVRAEHRVNDIEQKFATLHTHLRAQEEEAERREVLLKSQLDAIYKSSSWKMTEPLRKVNAAFGATKKTGKKGG